MLIINEIAENRGLICIRSAEMPLVQWYDLVHDVLQNEGVLDRGEIDAAKSLLRLACHCIRHKDRHKDRISNSLGIQIWWASSAGEEDSGGTGSVV